MKYLFLTLLISSQCLAMSAADASKQTEKNRDKLLQENIDTAINLGECKTDVVFKPNVEKYTKLGYEVYQNVANFWVIKWCD